MKTIQYYLYLCFNIYNLIHNYNKYSCAENGDMVDILFYIIKCI